MPESTLTSNREVYSVSELNRMVRDILESAFPTIHVEGELSNFAKPSSGHWYFSLKDNSAQIRCAMFRNRNRSVHFRPSEGDQVIARGRISLYEGRGDFQLIVDDLEEAGDGILRRAFEQLKQHLKEEGLFDESNKQPLPALPRHIALITSPTGAAVKDVLSVLQRRFPSIAVSVLPVQVQGDAAPEQVVTAIGHANTYQDQPFDLIIVTRGGGSLEDLWAFNTEQVARAIHESKLPVISAIGHEVDFTIADFVADLRAPTPSVAAEYASPDQTEMLAQLTHLQSQLTSIMNRNTQVATSRLQGLQKRLQHPGRRITDQAQRIDDIAARLQSNIRRQLAEDSANLSAIRHRLVSPGNRIQEYRLELRNRMTRLRNHTRVRLDTCSQSLALCATSLDNLSPLATLDRGYAIVRDQRSGKIIKDSQSVNPGELIEARLSKGTLQARITRTGMDES